MKTRIEEATERQLRGYNCAQAVACAYCDLAGVDESTMFKLTEGLGMGMGGMNGTCGAISAGCILAGFLNSSGTVDKLTKFDTQKLSKEMTKRFIEKVGALSCKEIKGLETGKTLMSCPNCVITAAQIVQDVLFGESDARL